MSIRLELTDPGGGSRSLSFERGPVNVGRARNADVRIEGDAVSRVHVVLEGGEAGWTITHRGSAIPTLMNGNVLPMGTPVAISNGANVQIAETSIRMSVEAIVDSAPPTIMSGDSFVTAEPLMSIPPPFVAPGASGQDVPTLFATLPGGGALRLELVEAGRDYVIGRADACDLSLEDSSCSRRHAIVRTDGTRVFLRDAGARNPVRINGRPIVGETPFQPGDVMQLGSTEIEFIGSGAPPARPSVVAPAAAPPPPPAAAPAPPAPTPFAPPPVAPPVAPPPAPASPGEGGGGGGWDAMVESAQAPTPAWQPDPAAEAPRAPSRSAPPPPPDPVANDWAAKVAPPPSAARKSDAPAWDVPAPPPQKAPPPKLGWHDQGGPGGGAGGPSWDGPPPVSPGGAPPAAPTPAAPPPPPPAAPATPPPPPAAPAAEEADLSKEPKVVTRRGTSQKGWLIAGAICMFLAVAVGLTVIVLAMRNDEPAADTAGASR